MQGRPYKAEHVWALNESPSEKEGKFGRSHRSHRLQAPSMKVPPKRKGNANCCGLECSVVQSPQ